MTAALRDENSTGTARGICKPPPGLGKGKKEVCPLDFAEICLRDSWMEKTIWAALLAHLQDVISGQDPEAST